MSYGHLSVKNQIMPGRYHHRNSACAARFATIRTAQTVAAHQHKNNQGVA